MGRARKPFHESVIPAIERSTAFELKNVIAPLLMQTAIPKGHDEITAAWRERCATLGLSLIHI